MNKFNLSAAHIASGGDPTRSPWRWLMSPGTQKLLAALELDRSTFTAQPGRGGGTWVPEPVMLAYAAWLDPFVHAALVTGKAVDPSVYATGGTETTRPVTGRLAGIEKLRPGQVLRVTVDAAVQPSFRSAVHVMGTKLGRKFSVNVDAKTNTATITRRSAPAAAPAAEPPAPTRPDGWIEFDANNPQHAVWGSREVFEAAQADYLKSKNSTNIDW
jgi:hypothetical protein